MASALPRCSGVLKISAVGAEHEDLAFEMLQATAAKNHPGRPRLIDEIERRHDQ
jgi:hypothetical protein